MRDLLSATSACISPSTSRSGRRSRTTPSASCTSFACGWLTEPKLENDTIATRGSTPMLRTASETCTVMSARVSASGSMLMLASAKNTTLSLSTIMYMPVATLTPGRSPSTCSAGRMVSG